MKILILILTLTLVSCSTSKTITIKPTTQKIPASFDEAEKWFDSIHNELPVLIGLEGKD